MGMDVAWIPDGNFGNEGKGVFRGLELPPKQTPNKKGHLDGWP